MKYIRHAKFTREKRLTKSGCRTLTCFFVAVSLLVFFPSALGLSFQFHRKTCYFKHDPIHDDFSFFKRKLTCMLRNPSTQVGPKQLGNLSEDFKSKQKGMKHSKMIHKKKKYLLYDHYLNPFYPRKYHNISKKKLPAFPKLLISKSKLNLHAHPYPRKQHFNTLSRLDNIPNTSNENQDRTMSIVKDFVEQFFCNSFKKNLQTQPN